MKNDGKKTAFGETGKHRLIGISVGPVEVLLSVLKTPQRCVLNTSLWGVIYVHEYTPLYLSANEI